MNGHTELFHIPPVHTLFVHSVYEQCMHCTLLKYNVSGTGIGDVRMCSKITLFSRTSYRQTSRRTRIVRGFCITELVTMVWQPDLWRNKAESAALNYVTRTYD
jgi:hypothetical protein